MVLSNWHSGPHFSPKNLEELFESLFYRYPDDTKPPIENFPIYKDNSLKGYKIQMALAGFKEEDLKVWFDERTIVIEGSNLETDIADKFKCDFKREFNCSNKLDLSAAKVSFENGLLDIYLPIIEPEKKKTYLFGQ